MLEMGPFASARVGSLRGTYVHLWEDLIDSRSIGPIAKVALTREVETTIGPPTSAFSVQGAQLVADWCVRLQSRFVKYQETFRN